MYFEHNDTRSITLLCDHTGVQWTVLRFQGNVTWWSITEKVSAADEENRIFLIRQVRRGGGETGAG